MGLFTVIDAVKDIVGGTTGFTATGRNANVSIGNYKVLTIGGERAAVIELGGADFASGSSVRRSGIYINEHSILIRLFHKYKYDGESYTDMLKDTDAVMAILHANDTLDSTVLDSHVTTVLPIDMTEMNDGEAYFLMQEVTLIAQEEVTH